MSLKELSLIQNFRFESEADKRIAKKSGRAELNGPDDKPKKRKEGKLSNKDKKKLDAREERSTGKGWKKGKAERAVSNPHLNQ
jgi:ATP-dependent RNA helicase DDX27